MQQELFIFIGPSGSGKGTQAKILIDILKQRDPSRGSLYIQTGQIYRDYIQNPTSFTDNKVKEMYLQGVLMPEFLSVYMWIGYLIKNYSGTDHIVFDGTPRKVHEAGVVHSIVDFYKISKCHVIHVDISHDEAVKRLVARQRIDDSEADIRKRLAWYESDVVPTIEYYRNNPSYNYIKVNGEQSIEAVHAEVLSKLGIQ